MAKIYYDTDIELDTLKKLTFAVIGYGNQGRAQALNLRDSGLTVKVGARKNGGAFLRASADAFDPIDIESATAECDVLVLLLPDEHVPNVYNEQIKPHANADKVFVFAHGFSVHHQTISLPKDADVILVAPTGPGRRHALVLPAGQPRPRHCRKSERWRRPCGGSRRSRNIAGPRQTRSPPQRDRRCGCAR